MRTPPPRGGSTIEVAKGRRGASSGWRLRRVPGSLNEPDVTRRQLRSRGAGLHFDTASLILSVDCSNHSGTNRLALGA